MTELFSFQGSRGRTFCSAVSAAWKIVPSLTNPVESPSDNLNLKVFDKFRNSIDFLTNILLCGTEYFRNFNRVISLVDIHRHKDEIIF